MEKIERLGEG